MRTSKLRGNDLNEALSPKYPTPSTLNLQGNHWVRLSSGILTRLFIDFPRDYLEGLMGELGSRLGFRVQGLGSGGLSE